MVLDVGTSSYFFFFAAFLDAALAVLAMGVLLHVPDAPFRACGPLQGLKSRAKVHS
jgi:hypothetical protein